MTDPTDPLAWVHRAEEDWLLARSALRRKVPLIYGTTFHAQQCAEKYIKALLVSCRQAFPWAHDLGALHELCTRNGINVPIEQDKLEHMAWRTWRRADVQIVHKPSIELKRGYALRVTP
jgi:HEPN domain-containing protein